jgi:hypothetical protein
MEKFFEVRQYGTASSAAASWKRRTLRCRSTRERVLLVVPPHKRPAEADDEGACEQTWRTSGKASPSGRHSAATVEEEMTLGAEHIQGSTCTSSASACMTSTSVLSSSRGRCRATCSSKAPSTLENARSGACDPLVHCLPAEYLFQRRTGTPRT